MADTPYGITGEPWDIAWEEDDLNQILKQIAASNSAKNWSIGLWHTPKQTAMFLEVLEANGYKEPTHCYWHKTDHATHSTSVASFTSSIEMFTIWFYPSRIVCTLNLPRDPHLRHNFFEHPQVTKKFKDGIGNVANPCQKPPNVNGWIVGALCMPGSTVLVVGPGAGGGEVFGAILKNCNVICIEKNRYQFEQLRSHIVHVKEQLKKDQEDEEKKSRKAESSQQGSQEFSAGTQLVITTPPQTTVANEKCASCGFEIEGDEGVECNTEKCNDTGIFFHVTCTVTRGGEMICLDCKRDEDNAACEAVTQVPLD